MECFYFLSEIIRPGCNADHHYGNVTCTLCLQKISKYIAKNKCPKSYYHSGERSGPDGPFV